MRGRSACQKTAPLIPLNYRIITDGYRLATCPYKMGTTLKLTIHPPGRIQRKCDEFDPVLTFRNNGINSADLARAPVTIDDQVQPARVAIGLRVKQRRPAGTVGVNWFIQFDAQAF